jgi:hypothetical protein
MSNTSLSWEHVEHLSHKVRNVIRRGYLVKTYYDKKLMQARIKTGHGMENDRIDIMHPVGYLGRVQADDKAEVFTMDVGGDSSRRVVLGVLGDREHHPKILEGESILYSPGDPQNFLRVFKKPAKKGGKEGEESGGGEEGGGDDSPDSVEAIYGKYGQTFCKFDGKKAQTYYKDEKKSTQVDDEHVHIRFEDLRVWIDKENIWSTKPILIKQDPDSKTAKATGVDESLPYDWDEATDTWFYRGSVKFGADVTIKGKLTVGDDAAVGGDVTVGGDVAIDGKATMTKDFFTLAKDPVQPMHAVTKQYVDGNSAAGLGGKVDRAGDTMAGYLTLLNAPPLTYFHAATKGYSDEQDALLQNRVTEAYQEADLYYYDLIESRYAAADSAIVIESIARDAALQAQIDAIPPPAPLAASAGGDARFNNLTIDGDLIVTGALVLNCHRIEVRDGALVVT